MAILWAKRNEVVKKLESGKFVEWQPVESFTAYDLITVASLYQPITAQLICERV